MAPSLYKESANYYFLKKANEYIVIIKITIIQQKNKHIHIKEKKILQIMNQLYHYISETKACCRIYYNCFHKQMEWKQKQISQAIIYP